MDLFTPIKEKKKLIEKLKKCCSTISKYNLNSPCLMQIIRLNGEYEVIISHDSQNGNKFNFYKIFESVTYDSFHINKDDSKYFILGDEERTSIPVVVSSVKLDEDSDAKLYSTKYDYSENSFYIFPKFVLEAIKADAIEDIEVFNDDISVNIVHTFKLNIKIKDTDNKRFETLFIPNSSRINNMFNLMVVPYCNKNMVNSTILDLYSTKISSFLFINKDEWTKIGEENNFKDDIVLNGNNNHKIIIYHNDFVLKNPINIYATKTYEFTDNIVTINLKIEMTGDIYIYLKYRYYEI